jgi:hypothetical protein
VTQALLTDAVPLLVHTPEEIRAEIQRGACQDVCVSESVSGRDFLRG